MWKLADFGISAVALSEGATTKQSRGTPCYRAPELLQTSATFTVKVDMWALGCILYECFTGSKAFDRDDVVLFSAQDRTPTLSVAWSSGIWHHLLNSIVRHLLHKDEAERPTAATTLNLLTSYKNILVSPLAEPMFICTTYLSYDDWTKLRSRYSDDIEWLYELAMDFKLRGEETVAKVLLEEMMQQYLDTIQRLHDANSTRDGLSREGIAFAEDPELVKTKELFVKILDHLPETLLAWICYEIATYLSSRIMTDWEGATSICRRGMEKSPGSLILPMLLSNLYAARGHYYDAMETEKGLSCAFTEHNLFDLESTLFGFYTRILPSTRGYGREISTLMHL